jgi:hypothetical protein
MEAETETTDEISWRMQTCTSFFGGGLGGGGLQTLHFKQLQGKVEKSCGTEGNILAWKLISNGLFL